MGMKSPITLAVLGLSLLAPVKADAQIESAPNLTSAFVSFCADPAKFKSCTSKVMDTDLTLLAERTFLSEEERRKLSYNHCEYRLRDVSNEDATRKILPWLAAHPETHALPTHDALIRAINTLWPCD